MKAGQVLLEQTCMNPTGHTMPNELRTMEEIPSLLMECNYTVKWQAGLLWKYIITDLLSYGFLNWKYIIDSIQ